jgi:hypothetical protein
LTGRRRRLRSRRIRRNARGGVIVADGEELGLDDGDELEVGDGIGVPAAT